MVFAHDTELSLQHAAAPHQHRAPASATPTRRTSPTLEALARAPRRAGSGAAGARAPAPSSTPCTPCARGCASCGAATSRGWSTASTSCSPSTAPSPGVVRHDDLDWHIHATDDDAPHRHPDGGRGGDGGHRPHPRRRDRAAAGLRGRRLRRRRHRPHARTGAGATATGRAPTRPTSRHTAPAARRT